MVATALMVSRSLEAATILAEEGLSVEVVDPRTLVPLDKDTILESVARTRHAVVVTEEARTASCAAELSSLIAEEGLRLLDAPVVRLGGADVPLPFAKTVQAALIPSVEDIVEACRRVIGPAGVKGRSR